MQRLCLTGTVRRSRAFAFEEIHREGEGGRGRREGGRGTSAVSPPPSLRPFSPLWPSAPPLFPPVLVTSASFDASHTPTPSPLPLLTRHPPLLHWLTRFLTVASPLFINAQLSFPPLHSPSAFQCLLVVALMSVVLVVEVLVRRVGARKVEGM